MSRISRRGFLKAGGGGVAAGAAGAVGLVTPRGARAEGGFPEKSIAKASELRVGTPVSFSYPDAASPCLLIKAGRAVPGGVGPDRDIVAFSALCTHMGCPVAFDASELTFKCPCHFSKFDAEKGGQMIIGQATENLPQIVLEHAGDGSIRAVGVDGLIYGRVSNTLA